MAASADPKASRASCSPITTTSPASIELFGTEKDDLPTKRDVVDTPIVQIHLTNRAAHSPRWRLPTVSKIGRSQIGDKFCSRKFLKNSVDSPIRHTRIGIAAVGLTVRISIRRTYHTTAVRLRSQVSRLDVIHHVNDHDKGDAHCRTDDGNSTEKGILANKS